MNDDILTGQWKQMKGSLKSWWGQFTDDDFDDIGGQKDKLIGWVQEKYGRTHDQAAQEVDARLQEYNDKYGGTVAGLKAKAHDIGQTVVGKASEAATAVRRRRGKGEFLRARENFRQHRLGYRRPGA
jgi:uncharacterized protein YjbJ (UPF0337 family)